MILCDKGHEGKKGMTQLNCKEPILSWVMIKGLSKEAAFHQKPKEWGRERHSKVFYLWQKTDLKEKWQLYSQWPWIYFPWLKEDTIIKNSLNEIQVLGFLSLTNSERQFRFGEREACWYLSHWSDRRALYIPEFILDRLGASLSILL